MQNIICRGFLLVGFVFLLMSAGCSGSSGGTTSGGTAMSFFVTSSGNGANGGNYSGLTGADAKCQSLATTAGVGSKTWRAYLCTDAINAKDRIGSGPWFNFSGTMVAASVTALHASPINSTLILTETGGTVPATDHDVLTGCDTGGTFFANFPGNPAAPAPTCLSWTSSSDNNSTYVGHTNWSDANTQGTPSWNSSHDTTCSQAGLQATAGSGRLYCFAID